MHDALDREVLAQEDQLTEATRTLNIGQSPRDLLMRVAPTGTAVALVGDQGTPARSYVPMSMPPRSCRM